MQGDDLQLQRMAGAVAVARRPLLFRVPRRRPSRAAAAGAGAGAPPVPVPAGGRKKRMAVARLGGGRRRFFGAIRRLRMRWLAAVYRRALRRLRSYYAAALRDLLEGAALFSTLHAQAGADCSFGTAFAPAVSVGF